MVRIKRGVTSHKRHKKILEAAKGYRMTRHRLVQVATEAILHAGEYAFAGRRHRKRQMRRLWIMRMNAALHAVSLKYSSFISIMKKKNIIIDRKILATLAGNESFFKALVNEIKK